MDIVLQATCSTDGHLRIYEAQDVMNLSQWQLTVGGQGRGLGRGLGRRNRGTNIRLVSPTARLDL